MSVPYKWATKELIWGRTNYRFYLYITGYVNITEGYIPVEEVSKTKYIDILHKRKQTKYIDIILHNSFIMI